MRAVNDPATALLRSIAVKFLNFPGLVVEGVKSRSWASATFTGARHEVDLRLEGAGAAAAAAAFLENLECAEFDLRGHILADISLVSDQRHWSPGCEQVRLRIEALTVEDA